MTNGITFGMPALLECPEIEYNAKLCHELGLSFVECNMNLPQYQPGVIDLARFQKAKALHGASLTFHLEENLDVCDFNPLVSKAYLDTVLASIELAKKLDAPILNMHLVQGVYFTMPEEKVYLYETYRDTYLERIRQLRGLAEEAARGTNLKICIENAGGYKPYQLAALDLLLESDLFCLTWDIGHDYSVGGKDGKIILGHSDKLIHMHLHDAAGRCNHLALGTGEIDLTEKLRIAAKHGCRCVLETKTVAGLKQSVEYLKREGWL